TPRRLSLRLDPDARERDVVEPWQPERPEPGESAKFPASGSTNSAPASGRSLAISAYAGMTLGPPAANQVPEPSPTLSENTQPWGRSQPEPGATMVFQSSGIAAHAGYAVDHGGCW